MVAAVAVVLGEGQWVMMMLQTPFFSVSARPQGTCGLLGLTVFTLVSQGWKDLGSDPGVSPWPDPP